MAKTSLHERIGQKYSRLTFIRPLTSDPRKNRRGVFRCDCGVEKEIQLGAVFYGTVGSCGCAMREYYASGTVKSHGDWRTTEYKSWSSMKSRCNNPNDPSYERYGARGIRVCDRWGQYENFLEDMGRKPSPMHSIDRVNTNGNYEPSNCKWSDKIEQQANRNCARMLSYGGETMTMLQWAHRLGMSWTSLSNRAKKGMTDEEIITTPRRNYPR